MLLLDPNTEEVIEGKPGEARRGKVDFGHRKNNSYNDQFEK